MTTLPEENLVLIKRILSDRYCRITAETISILDNLEGICHICLNLASGVSLEAKGVGMVDAIFNGLKNYYAIEFTSLNYLQLSKFFVKAKSAGTEAEVEVELRIKNSYGNFFDFKDNSPSIVASATRVSTAVIEYFINSEKAFLEAYRAYNNALSRGRNDLVMRYESELALLVQNTSYTELVQSVREMLHETSGSSE